MDSFLVLGFIPGTHIQISFKSWLMIAVFLACIFAIKHLRGSRPTMQKYLLLLVLGVSGLRAHLHRQPSSF